MSEFQSWQNQDVMRLLQQQLLNKPNSLSQIFNPNVTDERILPQNYQSPLETTIQSYPQHLSQSPSYPSQINPFQFGQFLPEQVFSQECATNYQHGSGLTSLDPTEEKILFGSDDDVSSSIRVTSQGNVVTQDGHSGTFASINSGSWSALMQDAVEASSSETGLHEEWSGLNLPKEPSSSNFSNSLTANQPSNFVVNERHSWNLPYTAVSGSRDILKLSSQYSSVISENPHFAANLQMKGAKEELRDQCAFQSNCSDGASVDPYANFYSQHVTPMTSRSMLEPNHKTERTTSNATAFLDISKLAADDSSTSHENSPLDQISFQKQFISNEPLLRYRYPSVHLKPNQPQIDHHYISRSDILDSNRMLGSQNTFFGSLGFTKMVNNTINNPRKSITESSLDSMVNNLWNILSVQQNPASIPPRKVKPSMFQSKTEGDNCLPGIAKISTNLMNQDQKQDVHDKARMLSISSDEARNLKEHSHFSGHTASALKMVQGSTCSVDATLQFGPKSLKRGCYDGPHEVGPRPKKQKADRSALVSWSRVVDGSHLRLCSTRIEEHGWARATNRLIEKVEDITKLKEDVPSEAISRNRLILTTKLTGQLFPALRYEYLTEDATRAYQKITCCVARSALEEACASVSSMCNSSLHSNVADRMLQKFDDKSAGGSTLLKDVENIMQKSASLESHFLRLDKRSSMVDLKLMWQELERYAIVSCLGKFHTQNRHVSPGTSHPQTAPTRHLVRQHATLVVLQIDMASLHGVSCLSL